MRPRVPRAVLAFSGGVLLLAGIMTPVAGAATYSVWSCRGPDGAPLSAEAWVPVADGAAVQDTCPAGGSLSATLRQSDNGPGRARGYRFALPPGARIAGYRVHLSAMTARTGAADGYQAGLDRDPGTTIERIDAGCPAVNCTFGVPDPPLAGANLITAEGTDDGGLAVATVCGRARGCYDALGDKVLAQVRLYRSEVLVRDDEAPTLGPASEMPREGEVVTVARGVSVDAGDGGGGVAAVTLVVDGRQVASQEAGAGCRQPYARAAPCPSGLRAVMTLDPAAVGAGTHSVAVQAVDAAGNVTTSAPVNFVTGATPPASAIAGISVERVVQFAAPTPVTIHLARSAIGLSVPGRRSSIAGVVRDVGGREVPGATVIVRGRPFGVRRAKLRLERTLTTDARGRFETPARGLSRLVVLDVNDAAHRAQEPAELRLIQRLRVTALSLGRSLRNGSTLTLGANVHGAGAGVGGKAVLVQALVGGRWTTVESLTTDAAGRARWRYRFRATTRRMVYRFRVKVERAGDVWPWPTTTSRALRVEVAP